MNAMGVFPWALAAVLWTPVAFAGGLGFPVLIFLMSLFFAFNRRENQIRPYMISFAVLMAFAAWSITWSPYASPPLEIDFYNGKYAIKATAVKFAMIAMLVGLSVGAALTLNPWSARIATRWLIMAFWLQFISIIALAAFQDQIIGLFEPIVSDRSEAIQNIGRNAAIFSISGVLLIAQIKETIATTPSRVVRFVWVPILAIVFFEVMILVDSLAGVIAVVFGFLAIYGVSALGRLGWLALGGLTSLYILMAPILYAGLGVMIGEAKTLLPASSWWRVETWNHTIEMIRIKPLSGWGIDSMRTVNETFGEKFGANHQWAEHPIVPNHPHNMFLHLWAELGLTGAGLAAITVFLLSLRLADAKQMSPAGEAAAAGLWASVLVICSFSFSLWNEWWWATIGLGAAIAVMINRADQTALQWSEGEER